MGHGEQGTCSARPPAFLPPALPQHPGPALSSTTGQIRPKTNPHPCSRFAQLPSPASQSRTGPAQGQPKGNLRASFSDRQIYPQLQNCLSPISATTRRNSHRGGNLLSGDGVHNPQSHADLMQFLPEDHRMGGFFPKIAKGRWSRQRLSSLSPSLLCQA